MKHCAKLNSTSRLVWPSVVSTPFGIGCTLVETSALRFTILSLSFLRLGLVISVRVRVKGSKALTKA